MKSVDIVPTVGRLHMHLSQSAAYRYVKVMTALAILHSTYDRFVAGLSAAEALDCPSFGDWLAERAEVAQLESDQDAELT
jgi:hypothetical protein